MLTCDVCTRYSLFTVLYPIGIAAEWWLMYRAAVVASSWAVTGIFYFFLGLYAPGEFDSLGLRLGIGAMVLVICLVWADKAGSVMMYSYMLKQRRKALQKN